MSVPDSERWNGNIHYHGVLVDAVAGAERVLEVGCGEGMLARRLRAGGAEVTGIDLDESGIGLAKEQSPDGEVTYVQGDFLTYPFEPGSFDGIVSVATLHHMDEAAALARMRELLRPGGTVAVVGLARDTLPEAVPWAVAAIATRSWYRFSRTEWGHPSPIVWPPPRTYRQVRRIAGNVLPGSRFRRHAMWRYSIVWTKPSA